MKTGKERKASFTQKLLVEGKNDQHVIWALCDKFDVHESFDIIDCGGKDQLLEQLPVQLKASSIETVGVILDADWTCLHDGLNSKEDYPLLRKTYRKNCPPMDGLQTLQMLPESAFG